MRAIVLAIKHFNGKVCDAGKHDYENKSYQLMFDDRTYAGLSSGLMEIKKASAGRMLF